jgi:hypothetical protein
VSQGFYGDRYYAPAAGSQTAEQPVSQVPARPQVLAAQGAVVSGALRAVFTPAPNRAWLVRRISVINTKTGQALVYVGEVQPQNFVCGTRTGQLDEDDTNQPIFVPEGSVMNVVWSSSTTGVAWCRIEYVEV